ncbi:hypothetical protein N9064_00540 [bacterium]|nr:hypothetical protein [bacterium]
MKNKQTNTPRCDEFTKKVKITCEYPDWYGSWAEMVDEEEGNAIRVVALEDARQLERELQEAKRLLKAWHDGEYGFGIAPTEEEIERFLKL